ncbi:signal transducer and activator of transcription 1-alpha/beta-like [Astyanax mexicanus]|uniref:Signal transducer and activator of transcription 1-alpha/beta-like n=1 Tax=Astyanax mexicanus TaxID=7994 RepID=A0A8T2LP76_ASTMX|nr:signal transducer and activator of transcription 1-alpha/beta-like [Astyanax mexicanus]
MANLYWKLKLYILCSVAICRLLCFIDRRREDLHRANIMADKQKQLDNQVDDLRKKVQKAEQDIHALEDLLDKHDAERKTFQSQMEAETNAQAAKEIQFEELRIKEMNKKREVGKQQCSSLTFINIILFTTVAECLHQIRQQLNKLNKPQLKFSYENDPISLSMSSLQQQALKLFKDLLVNSMVVERQPCMPTHPQRPLVLKVIVQFTVKIRLLVKLPELDGQLKVKVSFDKNLPETTSFNRYIISSSNMRVMDMEESSGCLVAEFRHLLTKEIRTVGSRSSESPLLVTEELHTISFHTQLSLPGLTIDLKTTTLPIVMTNAFTITANAWASILWYSMLCTDCQNLTFFLKPPMVKWGELSKVLSWQFSSVTKRGLSADQLSVLGDILLGAEAKGDPEALITWDKFIKIQKLSALYILFLPHVHMCRYIIGFISKEKEKALLWDKRPGTFLLRFSETCREGGITITWVEQTQNGDPQTHSVNPYTRRDLINMSLPDIIRKFTLMAAEKIENPLLYLYPDIPKDDAFGCYYSSPTDATLNTDVL